MKSHENERIRPIALSPTGNIMISSLEDDSAQETQSSLFLICNDAVQSEEESDFLHAVAAGWQYKLEKNSI